MHYRNLTLTLYENHIATITKVKPTHPQAMEDDKPSTLDTVDKGSIVGYMSARLCHISR